MSDDLIRRSDAIEVAKAFLSKDDDWFQEALASQIRMIPSADRPQGEWIEMYRNGFGNMICMCSKCNFQAKRSNFCPNCGAKMK